MKQAWNPPRPRGLRPSSRRSCGAIASSFAPLLTNQSSSTTTNQNTVELANQDSAIGISMCSLGILFCIEMGQSGPGGSNLRLNKPASPLSQWSARSAEFSSFSCNQSSGTPATTFELLRLSSCTSVKSHPRRNPRVGTHDGTESIEENF